MTAKYNLAKEEDKSFDIDYIYLDQCAWHEVPNQKVVLVYLSIRPANQPGFVYKFETCDYSQDDAKDIHGNKYNPNVIDQIIDQTFDLTGKTVE